MHAWRRRAPGQAGSTTTGSPARTVPGAGRCRRGAPAGVAVLVHAPVSPRRTSRRSLAHGVAQDDSSSSSSPTATSAPGRSVAQSSPATVTFSPAELGRWGGLAWRASITSSLGRGTPPGRGGRGDPVGLRVADQATEPDLGRPTGALGTPPPADAQLGDRADLVGTPSPRRWRRRPRSCPWCSTSWSWWRTIQCLSTRLTGLRGQRPLGRIEAPVEVEERRALGVHRGDGDPDVVEPGLLGLEPAVRGHAHPGPSERTSVRPRQIEAMRTWSTYSRIDQVASSGRRSQVEVDAAEDAPVEGATERDRAHGGGVVVPPTGSRTGAHVDRCPIGPVHRAIEPDRGRWRCGTSGRRGIRSEAADGHRATTSGDAIAMKLEDVDPAT